MRFTIEYACALFQRRAQSAVFHAIDQPGPISPGVEEKSNMINKFTTGNLKTGGNL
jgi:hypothetical protein